MTKIDKILERWQRGPAEVDKDEVLSVLDRYGLCYERKPGSHIVVHHNSVIGKQPFGAAGEFTLPVKGGKRVKGLYIKKFVLPAINIVVEAKE